jgi:putative ABC transport system ATP-binding protein
MLLADSIVHRYGDTTVLRAPTIELGTDEHCALVGPSGSGKSTLLNVLAGILRPSAGRVLLDGNDLYPPEGRDDRWRGRHIGVVPQKLHLLASLSAVENVALACHFAGSSDAVVAPLLQQLGLAARVAARPAELSLGEQQRVAIARAVVNHPRLLLADEPTSSLDDDNAQRVLDLLLDVAQRARALLVVATHDARIRGRFARVIRLEHPA